MIDFLRYPPSFRRLPLMAAFAVALAIMITAVACSSSAKTSTAPSMVKCTIALTASDASLGRNGGTGTVTVTAAPECAWTATSDATWIAGFAPASGQGNSQVEFRFAANPAPTVRLGEIVVNTSRIQVRQDPSACAFELATRSQSFSDTGGAGTATVSATPDGCAWTAASNVNWITIASGESGAGGGSVNFLVQANSGAERSGSLTIAGQTFTVRQGGAPGTCSYTLSPSSQAIGAAGGAGLPVSVSAAARCAWTASATVSWITLPAGASGTGNGAIAVAVAANTGPARSGSVTVEGQEFTVTQAGAVTSPCLYTLSSSSQAIAAAGGTGTPVTVSTAPACAWSASANAPWITLTGSTSGTGNGTIAFSVSANSGVARSGTVTLTSGQGFTVNQAAAPAPTCSYSVSPQSQAIGAPGGTAAPVAVAVNQGCAWTAVAQQSWIAITAGASGTGNGTVSLRVAANGGAPRSGSLTVAGQAVTINQAGACSYSISPTSTSMDEDGGAGTVSVSTAAGCEWTAASNETWIRVVSGSSGSGSGTVGFSVMPNDEKKDKKRDGTITIAGRTFTVSQSKK